MNILFGVSDKLGILHAAYSESHRKYHNMNHIARMFEVAGLMKMDLSSAQVLAVWWHDKDYTPCAKDNEERSRRSLLKEYEGAHPEFGTWHGYRGAIALDMETIEEKHFLNPIPGDYL